MDKEANEDKCTETDTYVYLDFNGRVPLDVFNSQVFMRIANLHEKNPLVQLNDSVFKGSYDYTIGTNLFFEEIEDVPRSVNPFEKEVPIHLKYSFSSMKVLNLKPVRILSKKVTVPNEVKKIDINLNWDYNELLKKFENGTLHMDAMVTKEYESHGEEDVSQEDGEEDKAEGEHEDELSEEMEMEQEEVTEEPKAMEIENTLENIVPEEILEMEYEKLKMLARRAVKRETSPELVQRCDKKYEEAYEYHNIERQIIQPSDAFQIEPVTDIDENTLSNCVDVDRCIVQGIIKPSEQFPRILTNEEKEKLFTLENFDNLSLAARYYVLKNHVRDLEDYIHKASKNKLEEKDEFGRTPLQTLEIYTKLSHAVMKRLTEIKYSLICESEVNLNDSE